MLSSLKGRHMNITRYFYFALDPVLWQKPNSIRNWKPRDNTKTPQKNFDYKTIADRLRVVSWSNYCHPTGMIKPVYGICIIICENVKLLCFRNAMNKPNETKWTLKQKLKKNTANCHQHQYIQSWSTFIYQIPINIKFDVI